jgi:hypothetical protein
MRPRRANPRSSLGAAGRLRCWRRSRARVPRPGSNRSHRGKGRRRAMGKEQCARSPPAARRMGPIDFDDLPERALLHIDSAPIIYCPRRSSAAWAALCAAVCRARQDGWTATLCRDHDHPRRGAGRSVASGRRGAGPALPRDIRILAARRARSRHRSERRAVTGFAPSRAGRGGAASALAINAAALVTQDRDFSRLRSLRVIS